MARGKSSVSVRFEDLVLPTYDLPDPVAPPIFPEMRVHQGTRGWVYPNPLTDHLLSTKSDRTWKAHRMPMGGW